METKKTGKIVAIIIAAVIIVAGVSVGVMAATGVFSSSKSKAFELLAQAEEKLMYSSVNEYIGVSEMQKEMLEKGGQTSWKVSNLKLDSSIAPTDIDLSEFTAELSAKSSKKDDKSSMSASLAKGDKKFSFDMYVDKEKTVIALPELIEGTVFKLDYEAMRSALGSMAAATASPEMQKVAEDFAEFFEDEIKKVKDEISCEKLSGDKAGYELVIKKETMNTVMNDFIAFVEEQKTLVDSINSYMGTLANLQSASYGELDGNFDLISELKKAAAALSEYTQDFSFSVYGEKNNLTGLETTVTVDSIPVKINVDFAGEQGNSTITMTVSASANGQDAAVTLIKKDTKGDKCETSFTAEITTMNIAIAGISLSESINTSDNAYSLNGSVSEYNNELAKLAVTGQVKDLKPGNYADLVLDEISLSVQGIEFVNMAMDIKMGVQDGAIEPAQGEEVNVTDMSALLPYLTTAQTSLAKILDDWGIALPDASGSSYNPLDGTGGSFDIDDALQADRSSSDDSLLDDDSSDDSSDDGLLDDDSDDDSLADIGGLSAKAQ